MIFSKFTSLDNKVMKNFKHTEKMNYIVSSHVPTF